MLILFFRLTDTFPSKGPQSSEHVDFHAESVAPILRAIKVSRSTVYTCFKSKWILLLCRTWRDQFQGLQVIGRTKKLQYLLFNLCSVAIIFGVVVVVVDVLLLFLMMMVVVVVVMMMMMLC